MTNFNKINLANPNICITFANEIKFVLKYYKV